VRARAAFVACSAAFVRLFAVAREKDRN
jgi:hypothetical protein